MLILTYQLLFIYLGFALLNRQIIWEAKNHKEFGLYRSKFGFVDDWYALLACIAKHKMQSLGTIALAIINMGLNRVLSHIDFLQLKIDLPGMGDLIFTNGILGFLVFISMLVCLPFAVFLEEFYTRRGLDNWEDAIERNIVFTLVHFLVGVYVYQLILVFIGGIYFSILAMYGSSYHRAVIQHFFYNLIVITSSMIYLALN